MLTLAPGYLLINGDFNFHMDVPTDASTSAFEDLLESAGLKQHVVGPTHWSGHTLDLIIDQQDDTVLSSFATLSDLPSDHYAVLCSVAFSKPAASKSQYKQHHLKDIDLDSFKADIIKSPLLSEHTSDPNKLADLYNSELQQLLDKHAPEMSRSITLRPHAPSQSVKNVAMSAPTDHQDSRNKDRFTDINVESTLHYWMNPRLSIIDIKLSLLTSDNSSLD